jgi:hypothetical protein
LINEVLEAKDYIAGKNLNKYNLYRTVYLMAKYHIMQGVPIPDIRQKIFDWGRENNIWIKYSVNDITIRAAEDKSPLLCPESVNVSSDDVARIVRLFDTPRVQCCALALLCYAKVYANKNGEFPLSSIPFSNWVGIDRSYFQRKVAKELDMFGYVKVINVPQKKPRWDKGEHLSTNRYKMLVPYDNVGEYKLNGNDIQGLFRELFEKDKK